MVNLRKRIEERFESYARVVYRHRLEAILVVAVFSAALGFQLPRLTIDVSLESYLKKNDPALKDYHAFRDQFGRDDVLVIAVHSKEIFNLEFFDRLKRLHGDLEKRVPNVSRITSLLNARSTRGEGDVLIVEDLFKRWPQDNATLAAIKQRVMSNPGYRNLLVSEDGAYTTIIINTQTHASADGRGDIVEAFEEATAESAAGSTQTAKHAYLSGSENSETVPAVREVIKRHERPDFKILFSGLPVVAHIIKQTYLKDIRTFMALATLTCLIILFITFRSVPATLLPLLIVILSLVSTFGAMAATGISFKSQTQILPSFLLSVGIGNAVHILAVFFHYRRTRDDGKENAIAYAFKHSGLAVVMTSITTAGGFFSFAAAEVAPVAEVGIFAGVGVMIALTYTLVLLPALVALVPMHDGRRHQPVPTHRLMDRFLSWTSNFSIRHASTILIISALIAAPSLFALTRVQFSYYPIGWFPENHAIRQDTETMDRKLRGSLAAEVVIDTGKPNGLYDPELLHRIDAAADAMEKVRYKDFYVGKAWSLTTILKEINQALHDNHRAHYAIPQSRELVAQEFLLFENSGSDDLADYVDEQFSTARLTVKLPFKDAILANRVIAEGRKVIDLHLPEEKTTVTGMAAVLAKTINHAITSMAKSYLIACVVITILMVFLIGRVRIGLLSMVPNLLPIVISLGVIGWASIPLDLFTLMVASIAIGLTVDDTIHFMHNFRRYHEMTGDPERAIFLTLNTAGRAMLVTTIVLSLGFFNYSFATLHNLKNFGLLAGVTILLALAADFLVAPALMMHIYRFRGSGSKRDEPSLEVDA